MRYLAISSLLFEINRANANRKFTSGEPEISKDSSEITLIPIIVRCLAITDALLFDLQSIAISL